MPKKRRKLSKDMESKISAAKKAVELYTAKINDIYDEEIQTEYRQAFQKTVLEITSLEEYYKTSGFTSESETMLTNYTSFLESFLNEYEL
tara:strand:+ start:447 stop:716 length:270 start_codon:yes stop_codon:yes gene_type:complete